MSRLAVAEASPDTNLTELVDSVIPKTNLDAEVVVISSREMAGEFSKTVALLEQKSRRAPARRVLTISTADDQLKKYFEA